MGKPPWCVTSHPGKLSLLPISGMGNVYLPKCSDALQLAGKGRHDSFHLWVHMCVAGKTVSSLVNTCHTWALWGETILSKSAIQMPCSLCSTKSTTTTTVLWSFFRDYPGEQVPEENFWTLWCKERLTEADIQTIQLGTTPSGLTTAHLHHSPIFRGRMPFLPPNQQCQSTEGN